jgi:hypothetical protein
MELDRLFWHFFKKFEPLPAPRSVAEAGIVGSELEFLKQWFADQYGKPRNWCDRTWQENIEADITASSQEMFGALFLIFASEICRDHCDEESVWPAIRSAFKANKSTYGVLFDAAGQPTSSCKDAIAAGARRLEFRNLIDRYGTQEYFETLKLQVGFTLKGAARRLPEWLDGQGPPTAVQILNGSKSEFIELKLESASFAKLWKTLQDHRRNRVSEEYASAVLESSPWVRQSWVLDLLKVAKLRPGRAPISSAPTEFPDGIVEPLCEPILQWDYPEKPRLILKLNEERINDLLVGFETATFSIDGRIVDRWTLQEGGEWRGKRELPCQPTGAVRPNLRPRLLSISSGDVPVVEIDLLDLGLLGEPLLIFNLNTGRQHDPGSTMDPNRNYAVLCEPDMEVPNARFSKGKDRFAFLLSRPLAADTQVICDGVLYWQPQFGELPTKQPIRLTLESEPGEIAEIGSMSHVIVKDVPANATAVSLVLGSATDVLVREGDKWRTQHSKKISLGMALGDERVRIRVEGKDYLRTVVPKLLLSLRGIAVVETDSTEDSEPQWRLLNRQRPLNRAAGAGKARIFVENRESELYEGPCLVRKLSSRGLDLRDLQGWGYPLVIRPKSGAELVLVGSVEDHGCVGLFVGGMLGKSINALYRRTPQQPSLDHAVWVWSDIDAPPRVIPGREIRVEHDGFVWKLPEVNRVAVLAVAYQGACLGTFWNPDLISVAFRHSVSAKTFALIRWLKLPALNPTFRPPLQQAVSRAPTEFVRGWLDNVNLPNGLVHRQAEQGLDAVLRAFFWNHVERNEGRVNDLVRAFRRPTSDNTVATEADQFKRGLMNVAEICPSLAYCFAKIRVRGEKYSKFVRSVVADMLRQPSTEFSQLRSELSTLGRDCATLIGISQAELGTLVDSYGRYLDGGALDAQVDADLRRLGERKRGRQYLAASMLMRLLEGTGG